jgi:uroporphyrinogen III methyltransferase / synthase
VRSARSSGSKVEIHSSSAAGIPLTARGVAASIAIVSGHCAQSCASPPTIPLADTIVVLMGVANADAIRNQLIAAGRSGDTPVAVIEWATHSHQRVEIATLATFSHAIARTGIRAPAVIVISETVNFRQALDWLELAANDVRHGPETAPRRRGLKSPPYNNGAVGRDTGRHRA